jgi:quinol monooxygenase YgiN
MTLTALLDLTLTPESLADAPGVLRETLHATRAFPGCLGVEVLRDTQDPTRIMIVERWVSVEADAAYRTWRATPQGASRLKTLLASPPSLTTFTTESDI